MKMLIHIAKYFSKTSHTGKCTGWHCCNGLHPIDISQAKTGIIQCVQHEVYTSEFADKKELHPQSPLNKLDPFIEKHPLIIPASHHVAVLLVRNDHEQEAHQGRQFSEGALRTAGL